MPIDLRSDTVTRPTPAMRRAIADAEVGDDMVGEDPTVNRLQEMLAERLGKEAALFVPSGTMSNQIAMRLITRPGDEVLIEETSHIANYEAGAASALSGVTLRTLRGSRGMLDVPDLLGTPHPEDIHCTPTAALSLENTTNIGGGRVWPTDQLTRVTDWARGQGLKLHLDGARLFNAVVACGEPVDRIVAPFDTISVCFSKGLGAPIGSAFVSSRENIRWALRIRKQFGGAMRQAGLLAAAAVHALEHHVDRLADDHAHAREFAEHLSELPHITIDPSDVETNLVFFDLAPEWGTASELVAALEREGVLLLSLKPGRLRACFHLDVSAQDLAVCKTVIARVLEQDGHNRKEG